MEGKLGGGDPHVPGSQASGFAMLKIDLESFMNTVYGINLLKAVSRGLCTSWLVVFDFTVCFIQQGSERQLPELSL